MRNDNLHLQENKTYNKKQRLDQILKDKDMHYACHFTLWEDVSIVQEEKKMRVVLLVLIIIFLMHEYSIS
jgi:hypothetical protein